MEKKKNIIYYNRRLLFEWEYLNGKKWNGKGYDNMENLIYILNNGNSKIKEYNYKKILIYEGEYLNGKKNGNEKIYCNDGKLIFEGEYKNGKKNGKGKGYDSYNGN